MGEIHENAEAALQLQCDPTEEPQTTPHNPPREPMQRAVFFGGVGVRMGGPGEERERLPEEVSKK